MRQISSKTSGFTLIELMVVIAIIGILLAIAIPTYRDYIIRGNLVDGTNQLSAYRAQMEQYYQDARQYTTTGAYTSPCAGVGTIGKWSYTCPTLTASTYTITATGVAGSVVAGFAYSVTEARVQSTGSAPSGWPTSASKWIMSKGG